MNVDDLGARFRDRYNSEPEVIASAPGRVNIIGEHTDYNGGEVLPIAIDRRTFVAVRRAESAARSMVSSTSEATSGEFDARHPTRTGSWWDYVAGVCAALAEGGEQIPQLEIFVGGDVPVGAGLSSSAALEVATALAITNVMGRRPALKELALAGWRAETGFVGVNSGVMDQFASALCEKSAALHLWCDSLATEHVPMTECVLIFDTATTRSLRGSEFNTRRAECEQALAGVQRVYPEVRHLATATPDQVRLARLSPTLERRALHVAEENLRVRRAVSVLRETGRVPGELLYDSHESLRDQYECSTPELDWFVDRMRRSPGIIGARLTGAGWGGCAIAVGSRDALESVTNPVTVEYQERFRVTPRTWLTFAGEGAKIEADARSREVVNG
ncbi:MAG: galactokinase [Gemmatimonadaceae bacterium]